MREILFKAKRMDNGEWLEGAYLHQTDYYGEKCDKHYIIDGTETDMEGYGEHYLIDKDTICQYTGLTDKNGNKIWENDVTRDTDDDMTMVVRWDDEKLRFVLDDYGMTGCLMEYGFDEFAGRFDVVDTYGFDDFCNPINEVIEVIGNIFDNPEQIGGGE